jgi:hypothetical protein
VTPPRLEAPSQHDRGCAHPTLLLIPTSTAMVARVAPPLSTHLRSVLGAMTTRGLRKGRTCWRRRAWKYEAGVDGNTTVMLVPPADESDTSTCGGATPANHHRKVWREEGVLLCVSQRLVLRRPVTAMEVPGGRRREHYSHVGAAG